jgi:hypothetical protein
MIAEPTAAAIEGEDTVKAVRALAGPDFTPTRYDPGEGAGLSVAMICVAEPLTIGMLLPLKVVVSGVPENPFPVMVSCVPDRVTLLMVVAHTVAAVSRKTASRQTKLRFFIGNLLDFKRGRTAGCSGEGGVSLATGRMSNRGSRVPG